MHIRKIAARFLASAALSAAAVAVTPASAAVYTFTGDCIDCTGQGKGTLTLADSYVPGSTISLADFVSFTYSSNLVPSLTVSSVFAIAGVLPGTSGPGLLTFMGNSNLGTYWFNAAPTGFWALGPAVVAADFGTNGTFSLVNSQVPEPAAWAAMALGFGVMGGALRRRRPVAAVAAM